MYIYIFMFMYSRKANKRNTQRERVTSNEPFSIKDKKVSSKELVVLWENWVVMKTNSFHSSNKFQGKTLWKLLVSRMKVHLWSFTNTFPKGRMWSTMRSLLWLVAMYMWLDLTEHCNGWSKKAGGWYLSSRSTTNDFISSSKWKPLVNLNSSLYIPGNMCCPVSFS